MSIGHIWTEERKRLFPRAYQHYLDNKEEMDTTPFHEEGGWPDDEEEFDLSADTMVVPSRAMQFVRYAAASTTRDAGNEKSPDLASTISCAERDVCA